MYKKLLFYKWGSVCEPVLEKVIKKKNMEYTVFSQKVKDYHADSEFALNFLNVIHREKIRVVFSYDYFPIISMLCEMNHIPYISWIYDCPMYTLFSHTIKNSVNYIYCFDRNYAIRLQQMGASHCIHLPLAGDGDLLDRIVKKSNQETEEEYSSDISFVGNLYNEKKNRFRSAILSEHTKGFIEGIIESQLKIYGYNFIKETLTEEIVKEVAEKCQLQLSDLYMQDVKQMVSDTINMEISAREREKVLGLLGKHHELDLYSGSTLPKSLQGLKIRERGFADYEKQMPYIFHCSKINVNITSKTIETGIPLRVFDILSCGGFCLTNYQSEIAEYFIDGEDLVMYSGMDDLLVKVEYYLNREEERKWISQNGYKKVQKDFNLEKVFGSMLESV